MNYFPFLLYTCRNFPLVISLFSIIGAIIIAIGLYAVVWGKGKDRLSPVQTLTDGKKVGAEELPISTADITKPAEEGTKIDKLVETSDGPMNILKLHM